MRINQVVDRQRMFEGFKSVPYLDTLQNFSVGYGNRVYHGHPVTSQYPSVITKAEAVVMLKSSVLDSIEICHNIYHKWYDLTCINREVLTHMAYQLGYKLRQFKKMNQCISDGDTEGTAYQMGDSLWARQTPRPASACIDAIVNGEWQGRWAR